MKSKTLLTVAIFYCLFLRGYGQDIYIEKFEFPISEFEKESFKVEIQSGDIEILGASDNKISITAEVFNAPGKNYICGPYGCMNIEKDDFKFTIKPREGEKIKKIIARVPINTPIRIKNWGSGFVSISNLLGEVQIFTNRLNNIKLSQVIGPLSLSGTYGDISVDFSKGISKKPMAISLAKGNISINFPKGEGVTIASLCPEEKSTLKDYRAKSIVSLKNKKDTLTTDPSRFEKRKISIAMDYKERIESRKDFGYPTNSKKQKSPIFLTQDAWIYEINGGGANIEIQVWEGTIRIGEIMN